MSSSPLPGGFRTLPGGSRRLPGGSPGAPLPALAPEVKLFCFLVATSGSGGEFELVKAQYQEP